MSGDDDWRAVLATHAARFRTEHTCPSCEVLGLTRVHDCDAAHLLCGSCGQCWHETDHGILAAVDPIGCSGCREQPKETCFVQLSARFPQFTTLPETEI